MEGYNHVHPIEVRFRDIDVLGHVNNSVMFTYIETARVPFLAAIRGRQTDKGLSDISYIVAHINCDFRRPVFYGQTVKVGTRVTQVNRSSMKLEHRVEADDELVVDGYCILVHYDYNANKSVPISAEFVAKIEAFEGRTVKTGE